jgi:hypothetical protein
MFLMVTSHVTLYIVVCSKWTEIDTWVVSGALNFPGIKKEENWVVGSVKVRRVVESPPPLISTWGNRIFSMLRYDLVVCLYLIVSWSSMSSRSVTRRVCTRVFANIAGQHQQVTYVVVNLCSVYTNKTVLWWHTYRQTLLPLPNMTEWHTAVFHTSPVCHMPSWLGGQWNAGQ